MRIILLGAPGSGKSIIAKKITERYAFPTISFEEVAEELSRMAKLEDELGQMARDSISAGRVSGEVCNIVVHRVLSREELTNGFVLVGYPKDIQQAEFIENKMNESGCPIDLVLMIDIDRDELMERRVGRIHCDSCGAEYNLYINPPLVEGICDLCGSKVKRRPPGYEENISNQLREYDVTVEPILEFFQERGKLRYIDGNSTEDLLWAHAQKAIEQASPAQVPTVTTSPQTDDSSPPAPTEAPNTAKPAAKKKTTKKKSAKKKTAKKKTAKKKTSKKKTAKKKTAKKAKTS